MKKKALFAVAAVVVLAGAFVAYSYFTPDISIRVGKPVDPNAENYAYKVHLGSGTKYGLPLPPRTHERIAEFGQANQAAIEQLYANFTTPMQITARVELADGQTIVTYSGTATDQDGVTAPYEKRLVFDFIVTKDIVN